MLKQLFCVAVAVLLSTSVNVGAVEIHDPYTHFFEENFGDFQEELETAKNEGKKGVLLFFEMDECPFCHRMKKTVLNRSDVQTYFRKNFKLFNVDVEGDIEVTDFKGNATTQKEMSAKQFRVRATPVFAFFDLEGNMVQRFTGATNTPEEFLWLGEFVADGHYKSGRFSRYKREKRKAESAE